MELLCKNSNLQRQSSDDGSVVIGDVKDTERYQTCKSKLNVENDSTHILSFNINTDEAKMLNITAKSLWPAQFIINELPLKFRFSVLILGRLCYTSKEPNLAVMNLYLKY